MWTLSFQVLEPSVELLLSLGQAVVGAASPLPHTLCRELRSRSRAVFASGGCTSCQLEGRETCFGPSFTWPGLTLVLAPCAPAVLPLLPWQLHGGNKCVENASGTAASVLSCLHVSGCPTTSHLTFLVFFSQLKLHLAHGFEKSQYARFMGTFV